MVGPSVPIPLGLRTLASLAPSSSRPETILCKGTERMSTDAAGYLTQQQVADLLKLNVRSVRDLPIPKYKINSRLIRFKLADVEAYMSTFRVECAEAAARNQV